MRMNPWIACVPKCEVGGDPQLTYLKAGRRFEPLRKDPRFKELIRRIGLPD